MRKDGEGERESERREDRHEVRGDGTFVLPPSAKPARRGLYTGFLARGIFSLGARARGIRDGSVKAISMWLLGLVAARKLVSTRNLT